MKIIEDSLDHLQENNMTYFDHLKFASYHSFLCMKAAFYLIIHSVLPCFFGGTGSNLVTKMSKYFTIRNYSKKNEQTL